MNGIVQRCASALALLVALFVVPGSAATQPPPKVWRIGFLATVPLSDPAAAANWAVFETELRSRGYVEGRNVVFERRFSEGHPERFPALAAELVARDVDVLVVVANAAAHVAKQATTTIPIVFLFVANPVKAGLVDSLVHPGGNLTGVADYQLELMPKRFELLKAAMPSAARVVVLHCEKCTAFGMAHADKAQLAARTGRWAEQARAFGFTAEFVDLSGPEDLERATAAAMRTRPDAIFLPPNPVNYFLRSQLAEFGLRQRVALVAPLAEYTTPGALMSYGPRQSDQYSKAAEYVDRVLRGGKPADMPVEQPDRLDLVINLATARALGLTIPPALLQRADRVIP